MPSDCTQHDEEGRGGRRFLIKTPLVTFWISWLCDCVLAVTVTVLPTSALAASDEHSLYLPGVLVMRLLWLEPLISS